MVRLPQKKWLLLVVEVGHEPYFPLKFVFGQVYVLLALKKVWDVVPSVNRVQSSDRCGKLAIQLGFFEFFEVVVVQDLNHFATVASTFLNHLFLENFSENFFFALFEQETRHDIATVGGLIVKHILVHLIQRLHIVHLDNYVLEAQADCNYDGETPNESVAIK